MATRRLTLAVPLSWSHFAKRDHYNRLCRKRWEVSVTEQYAELINAGMDIAGEHIPTAQKDRETVCPVTLESALDRKSLFSNAFSLRLLYGTGTHCPTALPW